MRFGKTFTTYQLAKKLGATRVLVVTFKPAVEDAWQTDVLSPAISAWYSYDFVTHQVSANPARVWKIRLAESSNPGYAKFHVIDVDGGTQTAAGQVTIEYAVQSALGAAMAVYWLVPPIPLGAL